MTTQAQRPAGPSGAEPSLTVFSPAKINLYLRIVGQRPDGYHDLETVMLPLAFGDELRLRPRSSGIGLTCDHPDLPVDDTNLVVRAAKLMAATFGVTRGVDLDLRKRTPLAAGLGGGSSNAATVFRALNEFWEIHASDARLHELAARLGSDLNFFLQPGVALCRGRGELVEPIPARLRGAILLINPGFGISTKWAYAHWQTLGASAATPAPDVGPLRAALAGGDTSAVGRSLFNSLEAASVRKFPILHLLKEALRREGARGALMSGSGATVFGLFDNDATAEHAAVQIRSEFGPSMWTQVTRCQTEARGI